MRCPSYSFLFFWCIRCQLLNTDIAIHHTGEGDDRYGWHGMRGNCNKTGCLAYGMNFCNFDMSFILNSALFRIAASILALAMIVCTRPAAGNEPQSPVADFYVASNGTDTWSGKVSEPTVDKDDGPFATFSRARDAVRELKGQGIREDIVVQIRGGDYRLGETLVFGLEDSGEDDFTISYEAFPGEKPVFSSDVEITGWKPLESSISGLADAAIGNVWVADVSEHFFTLYDGERRLPRARSQGFIPVEQPKKKASKTRLNFPEGTLKDWPNLEDVEIIVRPHHAWVANILGLASVDETNQVATTLIPATYGMDPLHFLEGTDSVWVENVPDALDEPGEWVLNSKEGKLYLWPEEDGAPKNITAPRLREYFRVEGDIDVEGPNDTPVRNLHFRGLTFTRGESYRVAADDKGLQHDWEMHDKDNALVRLRGAENCVIEDCHFTQSGGGAIRVDLHGQKIKIQGNHIEHIGGTGILLCGYGPGTKDVNRNNLVSNNRIHDVGEIYLHSPGVFLWQSGENRVANNLIHNTPYSSVIVSGVITSFFSKRGNSREMAPTIRWDEVGGERGERSLEEIRPFLHSHDNLVELNEIHHAMGVLGDGNGIYIRGSGANNIIRRNFIHHFVAPMALQSAIRTDGGQMDTLIAENIVWRCTSQGIQLKLNNRLENNIIADLIDAVHKGKKRPPSYLKLREGPLTGGVIQRNILYHPGTKAKFYDQGRNPRLEAAWAKEADTDYNLVYCAGDPALSQEALDEGKQDGIETHSLAMDPLFVDPENGDFRFAPDSPALKLGIVPIDLSKVGLLD